MFVALKRNIYTADFFYVATAYPVSRREALVCAFKFDCYAVEDFFDRDDNCDFDCLRDECISCRAMMRCTKSESTPDLRFVMDKNEHDRLTRSQSSPHISVTEKPYTNNSVNASRQMWKAYTRRCLSRPVLTLLEILKQPGFLKCLRYLFK